MPLIIMVDNNFTGALGEMIAEDFLKRKGYVFLQRNYRQKWGEIDLVFHRDTTVHFVEVKAVSYETMFDFRGFKDGGYRPEEQLTKAKFHRLVRTIDTWLEEEGYKGQFQLDLVTVRMVPSEQYALVEYFPCVVLD